MDRGDTVALSGAGIVTSLKSACDNEVTTRYP